MTIIKDLKGIFLYALIPVGTFGIFLPVLVEEFFFLYPFFNNPE